MSRATTTDRATSHDAGASIEHPFDLDSEHDPAVSRRASLAGLRREAAVGAVQRKGKPPAATTTPWEVQRDQARRDSVEAVRAALHVEIGRIVAHAHDVEIMTCCGVLIQRYDDVQCALNRLEEGISLLRPMDRRLLQREVEWLKSAVDSFSVSWEEAASNNRLALSRWAENRDIHLLREQIRRDIFRTEDIISGISAQELYRTRHPHYEEAAMGVVVEAMLQCARAIRMGVTTGKAEIVIDDLKQMIWHLIEIEAIDDGYPANAPVGKVLPAAMEVRAAISGRPELGLLAQELSSRIAILEKRAQRNGSRPPR